jgi:hypothetical protein
MNNTNPPRLSAEVIDKIYQEAQGFQCLTADNKASYVAGATNYAIKLRSAEEKVKVLEYDNTRLKGEVEGYKVACEELKRWKEDAKKLLTEVFQKHESGLLPDRFIYEKIKKFLYGE